MFINLKINIKAILVILTIIFLILGVYSIFLIFDKGDEIKNFDVIIMNNENYTNILKEVHSNPEIYHDKKIISSGYIYFEEEFLPNEFVLARNMIVCCESEPFIVGFLCNYDNLTFEKNTWVKIEGTLMNINNIPTIIVEEIKKSKIPDKKNVFPPTI